MDSAYTYNCAELILSLKNSNQYQRFLNKALLPCWRPSTIQNRSLKCGQLEPLAVRSVVDNSMPIKWRSDGSARAHRTINQIGDKQIRRALYKDQRLTFGRNRVASVAKHVDLVTVANPEYGRWDLALETVDRHVPGAAQLHVGIARTMLGVALIEDERLCRALNEDVAIVGMGTTSVVGMEIVPSASTISRHKRLRVAKDRSVLR